MKQKNLWKPKPEQKHQNRPVYKNEGISHRRFTRLKKMLSALERSFRNITYTPSMNVCELNDF